MEYLFTAENAENAEMIEKHHLNRKQQKPLTTACNSKSKIQNLKSKIV
jgi:hypothetical protein